MTDLRIGPGGASARLSDMLRRAGRADLISSGFAIDQEAMERSRALSPRDADHAVYHALFDPAAPHAAKIKPPRIDPPSSELPSRFPFRSREFRVPNERALARWIEIVLLFAILVALIARS